MRGRGTLAHRDRGLRLACAAFLVLLLASCTSVEPEKPLEEVAAAAERGEAAAIPQLIGMFSHPDPEVAQQAWEVVVRLGEPAEAALIDALDDEDRVLSEHAAGALGSLRTQEAVEPLSDALGRKNFRRYVAAWALGEIAEPEAVPALTEALGDEDLEVAKYATRALVKFGPPAVPALLEALESDSPQVRRYAVRALGEMGEKEAVEPLLGMGEKVDREVLLWALGRLGDPRGYGTVASAAGDRDWKIRLAAIQALRDLGDERALPLLRASLDDGEWIVREWAARGLESITGERATYRNQHGDEVYPYALYR